MSRAVADMKMTTQAAAHRPAMRPMFAFERFAFVSGVETWNVSLAVRLAGPLTAPALRRALGTLQAQYPVLRAGVTWRQGRPWFVETSRPPPVPLIEVSRTDEETWFERIWADRRVGFELPEGPLARLLWVRPDKGVSDPCELVLVCHHCICDGTSVRILMRRLLEELAAPSSERVVPRPGLETLPPPSRDAKADRRSAGLKGRLVPLAARLLLPAARLLPRRRRGVDHLVRWDIDAADTRALDKRCMLERTTANLAIATAVLRAFRTVRGDKARNRLTFPVDVRPLLPTLDPDDLFALADTVVLSLAPEELPFWEQARRLRDSLLAQRARLDPAGFLAMTERLGPVIDRLVDLQRFGRVKQDAVLSTLGASDLPDGTGPLAVQAVLGGVGVSPWRDGTIVYARRGRSGIWMRLVTREDLLSRDEAARIAEETRAVLARARISASKPVDGEALETRGLGPAAPMGSRGDAPGP